MRKILAILLIVNSAYSISAQSSSTEIKWQKVNEGLHLTEYLSPQKSIIGDSKITILKIDPSVYDFNLFSAKEKGEEIKTAEDWAIQKDQIAVINAGMYRGDFVTNVGYMKDYDLTNNGSLNSDNTITAFNRKDESVPEFQIIDRQCQDWNTLKDKYHSFTQSIRMVDCNQKNKWSQQNKKWSMVVMGKDKEGNALFIFSRSPYSVHDFIEILLNASLDIYNIMYLEGGPEASFYLNYQGVKALKMGSYETGFNLNDGNNRFWKIPNVIGISKK